MIIHILWITFTVTLCRQVYSQLPTYVHLHTQDEVIEANHVLLDKPNLCDHHRTSQNNIVVAVKTAPSNGVQRNILRATWLRELVEYSIPYVFVLGSSIDERVVQALVAEDDMYKDLIIGRFVDDYYNLTLKVIFLLGWTNAYCSNRWLLSVDDDTIVNVPRLIEFISLSKNVSRRALYCHVFRGHSAVRSTQSKWYVPLSVWAPRTYPNYCSGSAYMIPPSVLSPIFEAAMNSSIQPKIWLEDVFITGIVAKTIGVQLIHSMTICCVPQLWKLFSRTIALAHMGRDHIFVDNWRKAVGHPGADIRIPNDFTNSTNIIATFDRTGHRLMEKRSPEVLFHSFVKRNSILDRATLWLYHGIAISACFMIAMRLIRSAHRVIYRMIKTMTGRFKKSGRVYGQSR